MEYHVQVRLCNFTCRFALIVVTSVPGTKTSHVTTTTETLQSGNEIVLVTRISQSRVRTFGPGFEVRNSVVTGLEATFRSRHVSTPQFRSGLVFCLGFGIHVLSRFQFRCWKIWF